MVGKKHPNKPVLVEELRDKMGRASSVVFTEFRGLKAGDMVKLRAHLRGVEVELKVVKNSLLRRATEGTVLAPLADKLVGPTAVAMGFGEPVEAVRQLAKKAGDLEPFILADGYVEQMILNGEQIAAVAKLPPKKELQAKVVGTLQGPLASLVWTLQGVLTQFAGTLQAKIDKESAAGA